MTDLERIEFLSRRIGTAREKPGDKAERASLKARIESARIDPKPVKTGAEGSGHSFNPNLREYPNQ